MRGREDMADVLDVVEFAAAQLPGPDKRVAVVGCAAGCLWGWRRQNCRASRASWWTKSALAPLKGACHPCLGPAPLLCSYSWGSCVAAYALAHPAVAAYASASFPLGGLSWVLQTSRHFGEVARATHLPRLLVLGDQVGVMGQWQRAEGSRWQLARGQAAARLAVAPGPRALDPLQRQGTKATCKLPVVCACSSLQAWCMEEQSSR